MRSVDEVFREAFADLHDDDCYRCDEGCCCSCWVSGCDVPVMAAIVKRDAEIREQVRAETLAGFDAFAILLAATREGLARSGSKAKGVEQVREMLAEHAGAIARANEDANDRMRRGRPHWNRPWQPAS